MTRIVVSGTFFGGEIEPGTFHSACVPSSSVATEDGGDQPKDEDEANTDDDGKNAG